MNRISRHRQTLSVEDRNLGRPMRWFVAGALTEHGQPSQALRRETAHLSVVLIELPPASMKANPTLETVHAVERVLRGAHRAREPPLSYAEIERRMPAHRVRFEVIQTSVLELARHRLATVGSDGVMWIVQEPRARRIKHVPLV